MVVTSNDARQFARGFGAALQGSLDPELERFAELLADAAASGVAEAYVDEAERAHSAFQFIAPAIEAIDTASDFHRDVANIARRGHWAATYGGDPRTAGLSDKVMVAQLIGPSSPLGGDRLRAGLFVVGPHSAYPLHDHAAGEIYYVVSGHLRVRHGFDAPWQDVSAGTYSRTPEFMPHALSSGDAPVLIAWVWAGDVNVPSYWWADEGDGRWLRYLPERPHKAQLMAALGGG